MDIFPDWLLGTYGSGTGEGLTVLYGYDVTVETEEYFIVVEEPEGIDVFVVEQDQPVVTSLEGGVTVVVSENTEDVSSGCKE